MHFLIFQFSKLCISERVKYMYLIPFLHCFEIEMYDWSNQPFGIVFIDHQKNKMWVCNKIKTWIQLFGFSRNDFDLLFLYNVMDGYSIPLLYFCQSLLDLRNPWDSNPFVLTKLYHFLIKIVYIYILTIFSGFFYLYSFAALLRSFLNCLRSPLYFDGYLWVYSLLELWFDLFAPLEIFRVPHSTVTRQLLKFSEFVV